MQENNLEKKNFWKKMKRGVHRLWKMQHSWNEVRESREKLKQRYETKRSC